MIGMIVNAMLKLPSVLSLQNVQMYMYMHEYVIKYMIDICHNYS